MRSKETHSCPAEEKQPRIAPCRAQKCAEKPQCRREDRSTPEDWIRRVRVDAQCGGRWRALGERARQIVRQARDLLGGYGGAELHHAADDALPALARVARVDEAAGIVTDDAFPGGYVPALSEVLPTVERSKATGARAEQKRRKYQDESKKVSSVSVSRRAGKPQLGHATCFHVG